MRIKKLLGLALEHTKEAVATKDPELREAEVHWAMGYIEAAIEALDNPEATLVLGEEEFLPDP